MKKQKIEFKDKDEVDYLTDDVGLDDKEISILSYLKGFNRKNLKEWSKKGLMDFSVPVI